ncbi:peptidylprolyl isomerase [Lutibacter sp.]|uniref:peptidylprolyl isomerase n=1 Tax=Lutibacter sp. TaxID=1925666 RepID=UPI001A2E3E72|nr:peptidylprolyl isomerase [Lutibacter sp.]MBI9041346.1 peptidylprolyl isomerase [Lutibacter sp.]
MDLKKITFIVLIIAFNLNAQNNQKVLFSIDNEPVYTQEFVNVYKKNINLIDDSSKKGIENYLNLYVNYKLKVKEAFELRLDTFPKFKSELSEYKSNLIAPYLKDKNVSEHLIKEAYDRITKEVDVSHILLFIKPDATANDTLIAYNKLIEARNLILAGKSFAEVALKYSEDPTVQQNGGRIGYFTGLQMVYPFENTAFNTKIGDVSMPFKTKFGYHIVQVHNVRNAKGEVEVAHIMVKNDSLIAKNKIDDIYAQLVDSNTDFFELATQVSDDKATAPQGGRLNKFGTGQMLESFANEAFKLENEGDFSKPFQTQFGWHIVRLIKKYPIESFEKLRDRITQQVENDERSNLIGESVINRLFKEYKVVVNEEALQQFSVNDWKEKPELFRSTLLTIENTPISQNRFISYLNSFTNTSIAKSFAGFKEKEVINYYKQHIETDNDEFAIMFKEFKEGLLLFDLLEKRVWEKSKDSAALSNYFNENKTKKYNHKELATIKGTVISDFQEYLENEWIKELNLKYKVAFNSSEKKKLLKLKI